jgi:hypothetical protein
LARNTALKEIRTAELGFFSWYKFSDSSSEINENPETVMTVAVHTSKRRAIPQETEIPGEGNKMTNFVTASYLG